MEKRRVQKEKWAIALVSMICIAFSSSFFLKFNTVITWGVTLVCAIIWIGIGEKTIICLKERLPHNLQLLWMSCTIIHCFIIMYCIERGCYITGDQYRQWLSEILNKPNTSIEFEIGTLLIIYYTLILCLYRRAIYLTARECVIRWIPTPWTLVLGIGSVLYIKEGNSHPIKVIVLVVVGIILIGSLFLKHLITREQKITYYIPVSHYLASFMISLIVVIGIGIGIPDTQELPGTRWIRQITKVFNSQINWNEKIPLNTKLNNEFPLSESVLFEVNASEPLYLRNIAYSHYENGVWSIDSQKGDIDSYIALKSQYLHAEYVQTQSMLDEISYQHSQNPSLLRQYAQIANYESGVTNKKKYTIIQNPINKINYLTVNGVLHIEDNATSQIHYYKNINTCYFYGDVAIEPSNYTVEYYDHVPKRGSREYAFLHNINSTAWSALYRQIVNNRERYQYQYNKLPKLLLTYTPMVQYKNAQKNFLQIPKELKLSLESLARSIILSQKSDWARAETICTYLKNQYTYNLHSSYDEERDRIYEFLYENKEGICQEFASSMVLLCRSIGIPAKYVTGYLVTEKNPKTGNYVVREKDAHAFVEVYIAGYGWMTFDPTPQRAMEDRKVEETTVMSTKNYIKVISILGIIILVFVLAKSGVCSVESMRLQLIMLFKNPEKQLTELMKCTERYLEKQDYPRETHETLSQYAEKLKAQDIDILELVKQYEGYKYGNQKIESTQVKESYQMYKELRLKFKNK